MSLDPRVVELQRGGVDTHVHTAPDLVARKLDDFEAARQARERGMAAIVLKNHFLSTALRARLAEQQVSGVRLIGSVALNQSMGGVNPWAVEAAARGGAKVVWMPTFQSRNQLTWQSRAGNTPHRCELEVPDREQAVRVFDEDGELLPDTELVLELIRDRELVLASGHLAADEVDRLTARAVEIGVRRIILTHPEMQVIALPVELQRTLARRGCYFERTYNLINPPHHAVTMEQIAARIREVGPESTVLATDFGQTHNPYPAEGFGMYLAGLLEQGFSEAEIRRMGSQNARGLLDL